MRVMFAGSASLGFKYLDVEILQCDETHVASRASACYDQGLTVVMNISHVKEDKRTCPRSRLASRSRENKGPKPKTRLTQDFIRCYVRGEGQHRGTIRIKGWCGVTQLLVLTSKQCFVPVQRLTNAL